MKLHELKQLIDIESGNLRTALSELALTNSEAKTGKIPNSILKSSGASNVAQCYNGIENICKRISRFLGKPLPVGGDWHVELMRSFQAAPDNPNGFIENDLFGRLTMMRKFRHVVHHGYGFSMGWDMIQEAMQETPLIAESFLAAVNAYLDRFDNIE